MLSVPLIGTSRDRYSAVSWFVNTAVTVTGDGGIINVAWREHQVPPVTGITVPSSSVTITLLSR